jgi:hypothetical protein
MTTRVKDGRGVLVTGASGSGKTTWTMQQVRPASRLIVWDSTGQWTREAQVVGVPSIRGLHGIVTADIGQPKPMRIGYNGTGSKAHFAAFCKLAWIWLRQQPDSTLAAEELADVTSPGKAPAEWGEICRKARQFGANFYGLTQRPAESDKTILGNCSMIHAGRMNIADDEVYMSKCLRVPVEQVAALKDLEYIERDMRGARDLRTGKVRFR